MSEKGFWSGPLPGSLGFSCTPRRYDRLSLSWVGLLRRIRRGDDVVVSQYRASSLV